MDILWKYRRALDNSLKTMRKVCISTKSPHQKIRWNYGILRDVLHGIINVIMRTLSSRFKQYFEGVDLNPSHAPVITTQKMKFFIKDFSSKCE